ncbi:hypothetical protein GCM10009830_44220 [Glycomyces endophyticus]|uniref:Uncharacterized protein n=1 Tax=Glycomyces endophyticus TaxID=480996 RepID=A0ABP4TPM6_9ACTN
MLLAILPFLLKMPKTGAVYAILVVIIAVVLAQSGVAREIAADVLRDDRPTVEPEPHDPAQCLPRSGGDSECPGG